MKKTKRIWKYAAVLFLIFTVISIFFYLRFSGSRDILRSEEISTGVQNRLLTYDETREILFMGSYQNKLAAYQNNKPIWEFEGNGPFCSLKICEEKGSLYAANEDNHIYVLDLEDGSVEKDINIGKRMNDMDISRDGETIAVSSSVGKMKHYLTVLDGEGNILREEKAGSRIPVLTFTDDESRLIAGNNRGEVSIMDLEGNVEASYAGSYPVIDIREAGEAEWLVLFGDTSYTILNSNMEVQEQGTPDSEQSVTPTCIYTDQSGKYIFEGTEERYLYVISRESGGLIYETRFDSSVSDMIEIDGRIYITGLGDWIESLDMAGLDDAKMAGAVTPVLQVLMPVFTVLFIFCLLMSIGKSRKQILNLGKALWKYKLAYILLIPTFVLIILFNYVPIFMAFTRAFTNWSINNYTPSQIQFTGLENFRMMISEGYFLTGLVNLLILLVTSFLKVLTVPIIVAYLVYSMRSGRKKYIFRFLFVLPMVVPSVVNALLWNQIYDPSIGLLNQLLGKLGLENLQHVWLGNEKTALWAIIFVGFPFVNALAFLVFYGGFLDIDTEMLEAARVDGAGRWKTFWSIQIPLIRPQIKMILVLTFIGTIQDFTNIYILTGGGPGKSTYVPGLELYFNATQFGRYGYACALGLVMFCFILIPTIINMRKKEE